MTPVTLDAIASLATQLVPADQLRLIERLAAHLAGETAPKTAKRADAWERLNALREEFRAMGPGPRTAAEQLEADRAERQAMIEGRDVHP